MRRKRIFPPAVDLSNTSKPKDNIWKKNQKNQNKRLETAWRVLAILSRKVEIVSEEYAKNQQYYEKIWWPFISKLLEILVTDVYICTSHR